MPEGKALSRDDVSKRLDQIHRSTKEKLESIDATHRDIFEIIEGTNCQAVLERIARSKMEFEWTGPFAGKFLSEGFNPALKSEKAIQGPFATMVLLQIFKIEHGEGFRLNEDKRSHCWVVDPTQPEFFTKLEKALVQVKLEERGIEEDSQSAVYREEKARAEKEAQAELWGSTPPSRIKS